MPNERGYFTSGKKIYSNEFKLNIVQEYLKGDRSLREVARKFHCDPSDVRKWRDIYLEHGAEGLCITQRSCTGEFKVNVVEYMESTGASARQAAAHFNISSHPTIEKWKHIYYEQGKEALFINHRGRPKTMKNKKAKSFTINDIKTNEDLLNELQRLQMENEYLKKLNALIQEEEKLQH